MSDADNIVTVKISGRNYNIKCPREEAHELQASAAYLNEQIRNLRQNNHTSQTESITIVAALNVCHQLMLLKKQQNKTIEDMHEKITDLQQKIQNFLAAEEPVEV